MGIVGATTAAYLALHTTADAGVKSAAYDVLREKLVWTRQLLAPLREALTLFMTFPM